MLVQQWLLQDQTTTDPAESAFFPWISLSNGFEADWAVGLVYAAIGIVGALVFIYFAFDEALPGMGGRTRVNDLEADLRELERQRKGVVDRRQELLGAGSVDKDRLDGLDSLTKAYDEQVRVRQAEIAQARRMRLAAGIPLYVILGGVVASAFATNLLQAVIIGFGWTGVVQSIGLRQRTEEVKQASAKEIEDVQSAFHAQLDLERQRAADAAEQKARELGNAVLALSTAVAGTAPPGGTAEGHGDVVRVPPDSVTAAASSGSPPPPRDTLEPDLEQLADAVLNRVRGWVLGDSREGER